VDKRSAEGENGSEPKRPRTDGQAALPNMDAIAKAKALLEKQKALQEKLKKLPQASTDPLCITAAASGCTSAVAAYLCHHQHNDTANCQPPQQPPSKHPLHPPASSQLSHCHSTTMQVGPKAVSAGSPALAPPLNPAGVPAGVDPAAAAAGAAKAAEVASR
jgi:hypothetical protein